MPELKLPQGQRLRRPGAPVPWYLISTSTVASLLCTLFPTTFKSSTTILPRPTAESLPHGCLARKSALTCESLGPDISEQPVKSEEKQTNTKTIGNLWRILFKILSPITASSDGGKNNLSCRL